MFINVQIPVNGQDPRAIASALWALWAANMVQMRPDYPSVYAFARYEREPLGREQWQTADQLLRTRVGDCEDLASYQVAWLKVTGRDPHDNLPIFSWPTPNALFARDLWAASERLLHSR